MLTLLAGVAALGALALLASWFLARSRPAWWTPAAAPSNSADAAERLEHAVMRQITAMRPVAEPAPALTPAAVASESAAEWAVSIRQEDVAAWLQDRFPRWVASRGGAWPEDVSPPRIQLRADSILLGAAVRGVEGDVLWVDALPEVRADGSLWLAVNRTGIGRLPLPAAQILERLPQNLLGDAASRVLDIAAGRAPIAPKAELSLDDGRRVRLLSLRVHDGWLEVKAATIAPE